MSLPRKASWLALAVADGNAQPSCHFADRAGDHFICHRRRRNGEVMSPMVILGVSLRCVQEARDDHPDHGGGARWQA
jgi:hypothetical protein